MLQINDMNDRLGKCHVTSNNYMPINGSLEDNRKQFRESASEMSHAWSSLYISVVSNSMNYIIQPHHYGEYYIIIRIKINHTILKNKKIIKNFIQNKNK